jgi:arylsulfatase A-like enzyme
VTLALMALHGGLFSARGRRPWLAAAPATALLLGLVVAGYYADSRVEYTRYESMFHLPVEVVYGFAAIVACAAAARVFGDPERIALSRRALVATALVAALGLSSIVYGAVAMDASQTAKALFWGRSIVARRAFQAARWATDRDRDGFAATFGGADPDDADATRNPMAPEVPGNGVDENGIGGDLAASEFEPGALFGPPGGPAGAVQPAQVAAAPRNVLIITIDCLRADHLSSYGYGKRTSPNIDRFAADALLFERAYAQGTNTGHSLTSMFRSSYGDDIFDDRVPTFARLALEAGYRNEFLNAVRTDVWLNASRWDRYKTLIGDFEVAHDDGDRLLDADALTDRAVEMLRAQDPAKPHMTWVHYFDCHQRRKKKPGHDFGRSPAGIFDSNVAYVDEHVERLFAYLRESGALDRTMVVISADHGEAFMEHGARDHNNKPYNNNTHVPLIVRAPGVAPGRVAEPCALVDVAPTVLAYMGIPTPSCYRGIDLVAAVREGGPPRRQIMCETPRNLIESSFYSWALVDWPHKILWDVRSNTIEVFDIEADPGERRNLADRDPALAARMRAALGAWLDRETARTRAVGPGDGDLDDTEQ